MKVEIEEWYAEKKLPVDRIIDIGMKRHGIKNKEAILQALEEEYERRTEPSLETFKDITIAWDVWARARGIQSDGRVTQAVEKFNADKMRIKDLTELLEKSNQDNAELNLKFDAKVSEVVKGEVEKLEAGYRKKLNIVLVIYTAVLLTFIGFHLWKMGVF